MEASISCPSIGRARSSRETGPVQSRSTPSYEEPRGRPSNNCSETGVAKQIGVSNFGERHPKELLGYATVGPAVNQVEVHPYNQRVGL